MGEQNQQILSTDNQEIPSQTTFGSSCYLLHPKHIRDSINSYNREQNDINREMHREYFTKLFNGTTNSCGYQIIWNPMLLDELAKAGDLHAIVKESKWVVQDKDKWRERDKELREWKEETLKKYKEEKDWY